SNAAGWLGASEVCGAVDLLLGIDDDEAGDRRYQGMVSLDNPKLSLPLEMLLAVRDVKDESFNLFYAGDEFLFQCRELRDGIKQFHGKSARVFTKKGTPSIDGIRCIEDGVVYHALSEGGEAGTHKGFDVWFKTKDNVLLDVTGATSASTCSEKAEDIDTNAKAVMNEVQSATVAVKSVIGVLFSAIEERPLAQMAQGARAESEQSQGGVEVRTNHKGGTFLRRAVVLEQLRAFGYSGSPAVPSTRAAAATGFGHQEARDGDRLLKAKLSRDALFWSDGELVGRPTLACSSARVKVRTFWMMSDGPAYAGLAEEFQMHFPWAQVSFVDGQVSIEAPDRAVLIEVPVLLRLNMTERGFQRREVAGGDAGAGLLIVQAIRACCVAYLAADFLYKARRLAVALPFLLVFGFHGVTFNIPKRMHEVAQDKGISDIEYLQGVSAAAESYKKSDQIAGRTGFIKALQKEFYMIFGGNILLCQQAIDKLLEQFELGAEDSFNPFSVRDGETESQKGARIIAKKNFGGVINRETTTFLDQDLKDDMFSNRSTTQVLIPATSYLRNCIKAEGVPLLQAWEKYEASLPVRALEQINAARDRVAYLSAPTMRGKSAAILPMFCRSHSPAPNRQLRDLQTNELERAGADFMLHCFRFPIAMMLVDVGPLLTFNASDNAPATAAGLPRIRLPAVGVWNGKARRLLATLRVKLSLFLLGRNVGLDQLHIKQDEKSELRRTFRDIQDKLEKEGSLDGKLIGAITTFRVKLPELGEQVCGAVDLLLGIDDDEADAGDEFLFQCRELRDGIKQFHGKSARVFTKKGTPSIDGIRCIEDGVVYHALSEGGEAGTHKGFDVWFKTKDNVLLDVTGATSASACSEKAEDIDTNAKAVMNEVQSATVAVKSEMLQETYWEAYNSSWPGLVKMLTELFEVGLSCIIGEAELIRKAEGVPLLQAWEKYEASLPVPQQIDSDLLLGFSEEKLERAGADFMLHCVRRQMNGAKFKEAVEKFLQRNRRCRVIATYLEPPDLPAQGSSQVCRFPIAMMLVDVGPLLTFNASDNAPATAAGLPRIRLPVEGWGGKEKRLLATLRVKLSLFLVGNIGLDQLHIKQDEKSELR
ncbi:unnamed protein product, partial [Effrenium voratum]